MASFRDPSGSVVFHGNRILRIVNPSGMKDLHSFFGSKAADAIFTHGRIVRTEILSPAGLESMLEDSSLAALYNQTARGTILEHERIFFPSFPYEWPPEMLYAAGVLTIELAQRLLQEGLGLKDATPYNILFDGPKPVFIDVLSFERREPRDPTWLPYAQFVRTFVLPLLSSTFFAMPLAQTLVSRRDGLQPEEVYRWTTPLQKLRPLFMSLVSLPKWLGAGRNQGAQKMYTGKLVRDPAHARFILESLFNRLLRTLGTVARPKTSRQSCWSDYMTRNNNYSHDQFQAKERFVQDVLEDFHPRRLLDVGCNTGHFSVLAASAGASVVAIDYDPAVVGEVWKRACDKGLDILPLVVDLTRPTPAIGWLNRECPSFIDRATGTFDAVLMLAVLHHMVVTERIPIDEVLSLAARVTTNILVIEFIDPADSMFRRLTRGHDHLYTDFTAEQFENVAVLWFDIVRVQHFESSHRRLYLLRKKSAFFRAGGGIP